jgi:branched-chain amino acid transport system substrate-binding protein
VPGVTDTQIILGTTSTLTGVYGAVYSALPKAMDAYFKYINETQGGVCGREIVLKVEDDHYDPAGGLEATRKLVEKEKVFFIVGPLVDGIHLPAGAYLNEKGIPDLFTLGGEYRWGGNPDQYPWSVTGTPDYISEGRLYGRYTAQDFPGKKVGALGENNDLGRDGLKGLKEGLEPDKNELVSEQFYEPTAVDIRSELTNLQSAGAEVVVAFATPGFVAQTVKYFERTNWHPQLIISYASADPLLFTYAAPELFEGTISFAGQKQAEPRDDPAVAQHIEIMRKYGGPAPGGFSIGAQIVAELTVDVLKRACDKLTRQGVMEAVESTRGWHSGLALDGVDFNLSHTDHFLVDRGRMQRVVVENGKGRFELFGPLLALGEEQGE